MVWRLPLRPLQTQGHRVRLARHFRILFLKDSIVISYLTSLSIRTAVCPLHYTADEVLFPFVLLPRRQVDSEGETEAFGTYTRLS